ncbi:MAG TPA: hypothetical protein VD905_04990 [Flavobacteriales bacterium]|nr:hypothetical protein [Flavobacteriales bacterium]
MQTIAPIVTCLVFVGCSETKTEFLKLPALNTAIVEYRVDDEVKNIQLNCSDTVGISLDTFFNSGTQQPKKEPTGPEWKKFKKHKSDWALGIDPKHVLYSYKVDSIVSMRYRYLNATDEYSDYAVIDVLNQKHIKTLTTIELLYYCLAYPGLYSQNCNAVVWPQDKGNYFYAQLPNDGDERSITDLQKRALKSRRNELTEVIAGCIQNSDTVDMGILLIVKELRLTELIPLLCKKADFGKNAHCHTVLIGLLNKSNYAPWYNSALYMRFANYFEYSNATDGQADELKKFALDFYKTTALIDMARTN